MADRTGRCQHGAEWLNCLTWHVREPFGPKREGKYTCPACGGRNLTINRGTKGARVVLTCHDGCTWQRISAVMMLDHGVHHTCLGIDPPREPEPGTPSRAALVTDETIANAKRACAIRKLPVEGLNLRIRVMCEQAIWEGDGDLPPVPAQLIPIEKKPFVALYRRAGFVTGNHCYGLFDQWAAGQ